MSDGMSDEEKVLRDMAAEIAAGLAEETRRPGATFHPRALPKKIQEAFAKVEGLGDGVDRPVAQPAGEIAVRALTRAKRRASGDERPVPSPWPTYNEALGGGYWPGVHVLVSGTGAGKSTIAADVAIHAAKAGHPVGIVSLELGEDEQALRLLSGLAGVWFSDVITGRKPSALAEAEKHLSEFQKLPVTIAAVGPMGWTADNLSDLWADMKRHREAASRDGKDRTPLIVVDYLQLIASPPGTTEPIRERIGRAAYRAHGLANEFGAACLLVSSIARGNYSLVGADNKARHEAGVKLTTKRKKDAQGRYKPAPGGAPEEVEMWHNLIGSDALVGLGKEAGEVEFSAVSVTAISKVQGMDDARALMLAKNRFGQAAWTGLELMEGTFRSHPSPEAIEEASAAKPGSPGDEDDAGEGSVDSSRRTPSQRQGREAERRAVQGKIS